MRWALAAICLIAATCADAAELRVISPGVISNSGLPEVAAAFEKQTRVHVAIQVDGMGTIIAHIRTQPGDVVMLPMDLMGTLILSGGAHDFTPLGRVEIGLFKKPAAPSPDIGSVPALAAALKAASAVFFTDPATGSMQAAMSDALLKRPEFVGVHGIPIKGDAEPALKRGDGDDRTLGLGLVHGPHAAETPTGSPYLVGVLPPELGMHMDMATAISARAANAGDAARFIQFALSPAMREIWRAKGVDRY